MTRSARLNSRRIDNDRQIKKLLKVWEENTERIIDALQPPRP